VNRQRGIAIGLVLGLALGLIAAASGPGPLMRFAVAIEPLGTAFVNLVRMVVVPLVAATVFTGVARLGDARRVSRLGGVALLFFWSTTLVAIVIGMTMMRLVLPFAPPTVPPGQAASIPEKLPGTIDFLLGLIPANPIDAAAKGALLPLIVFLVLFGAAAATLAPDVKQRLIDIADAVAQAMIRLVHWILWVAPLGVFALAASLTARSGWSMLQNLAIFIAGVLVGLAVFYMLVYLNAVRFLSRVPVARYLKACLAPAAMGFSTTSSAASLPALFESAASLGLKPETSGFVLSLGAAINRAGSALFQGAALIFLAHIYGITVSPAMIGSSVFAILLISQTVASVPSAGVITLAPVIGALGIPASALAILLGVDRIPDMARTGTQVTGHLAAAAVAERFSE
jgi:Na+/H+-dicarboxylate symporter